MAERRRYLTTRYAPYAKPTLRRRYEGNDYEPSNASTSSRYNDHGEASEDSSVSASTHTVRYSSTAESGNFSRRNDVSRQEDRSTNENVVDEAYFSDNDVSNFSATLENSDEDGDRTTTNFNNV